MAIDIDGVVASIGTVTRFRTVDEMHADLMGLAARHPGVARLGRAGTSRGGDPLWTLTVGEGPRHALLVGLVHPNEPIGAITCQVLARRLCQDRALREGLGHTFTFLPVADPDGTRRNEAWFDGPFEIGRYARAFYRPPAEEQVEWTFPVEHGRYRFDAPLPETAALMRLMDDRAPDLLVSLHNSGFGGAYWYLSDPAPEPFYRRLHAAAARQAVPLSLGEPEAPWIARLCPAVYRTTGLGEAYDHLERSGGDPLMALSGGTSSSDWARRRGYATRTLVCEVPYFTHPSVDDASPSGLRRLDSLTRAADGQAETAQAALDLIALSAGRWPDGPYLAALRSFLPRIVQAARSERTFAMESVDPALEATVAQAFHARVITRFYLTLIVGMLARAVPAGDPLAPRVAAFVDGRIAALEAESAGARALPIGRLVAVQLESVLWATAWAAGLDDG